MELFLLQVGVLLRPILFLDVSVSLFGLSIFELGAIGLFALLMAAFLMRASVGKDICLSAIDLFIFGYSLWCIATYVIYPDKVVPGEVAKWIIPLLTYTVAKNVIRSREQYQSILAIMIAGYVLPVIVSALLIGIGQGVDYIDFWTKVPRYKGGYANTHNMAHSMGLLIMSVIIYATLRITDPDSRGNKRDTVNKTILGILCALALYCLYFSYVRTAILGLLIFGFVYLYPLNKKLLITAAAVVLVMVVVFVPAVEFLFRDVIGVVEGTHPLERIGSGRPYFWMNNLERFYDLPIDRQLAGSGIGNRTGIGAFVLGEDNIWASHNDYLSILIESGVVGFLLFIPIHVLLFMRTLRIAGKEKYVFVAFFVATAIMNFFSNSYITRFGIAQLYYIVMLYVELPRKQNVEPTPAS